MPKTSPPGALAWPRCSAPLTLIRSFGQGQWLPWEGRGAFMLRGEWGWGWHLREEVAGSAGGPEWKMLAGQNEKRRDLKTKP